jgi:hypothetical protein
MTMRSFISSALIHVNTKFMVLLLLTMATNSCSVNKKNRNVPHGHKGKLLPYTPGPFAVKLTAADEKALRSGYPVTTQAVSADPISPATVVCIQDVDAPVSAVWKQILDMDQYHKKVSGVTESRNYFVSTLSGGRMTIKTKQVLGVLPGYSVRMNVTEHLSLHVVEHDNDSAAHSMDIVCLASNVYCCAATAF